MADNYTLKQIQLRFGIAPHVLIHLCEKGVISPDITDTTGRGRWREFSKKNIFEFAVALELRKYEMPVTKVAIVIKVLSTFERATRKAMPDFSIPDSLVGRKPKIELYLFNGDYLVFSIAQKSFVGFSLKANKIGSPDKLKTLPDDYLSYLLVDLSELAESAKEI